MWVEKHRGTYRIRDRVGLAKVTIADGFPTKAAAVTRMTLEQADAIRGQQLVIGGDRTLLSDWIDEWWADHLLTLRASSRVSAEGILRRYIRPMLGAVPLGDLDHRTVQRWTADLLAGRTHVPKPKPLAGKTVRNAHGLLHLILAAAAAQKLIGHNPCEDTRLPAKTHHEMRFLTEPDADRLIAAIQRVAPHYVTLIMLILATGLRWGEAVGLRVRHVDVLAGRLVVLKATSELADTAEIVDEEPKTSAGRRTITIPPHVAELLVPLTVNRGRDERLFTAPKGGVVRQRVFYKRWMIARKLAGLDGLRIHDLRHTHAAWLISAGTPLTAVQRRLGHSSITVTSDLYGHLMPAVDEQIMTTLTAALPTVRDGDHGGPAGGTQLDPVGLHRTGQDVTGTSVWVSAR